RMLVIRTLNRTNSQIQWRTADSLSTAVDLIEERMPDCALVDNGLPDGSATDFLAMTAQRGIGLPVVVVTGHGDQELGRRLLASGAQDFLEKVDIAGPSLIRSIRYAIERHRNRKKLEDAVALLESLSYQDPLTATLNRRGLEHQLSGVMARARRNADPVVAILLDCDDFKSINEAYGHSVGDETLVGIADVLVNNCRESNLISRVGGDEFLILLNGIRLAHANDVARRLIDAISAQRFAHQNGGIRVTASAAVVSVDWSARDIEDVIEGAHLALQRAKRGGKNRVVCWGSDSHIALEKPSQLDRIRDELSSEQSIRMARLPVLTRTEEVIGYRVVPRGSNALERRDMMLTAARELDILCDVDMRLFNLALQAVSETDDEPVHWIGLLPSTVLSKGADALVEMIRDADCLGRVGIAINEQWLTSDLLSFIQPVETLREAGVDIALEEIWSHQASVEALIHLSPSTICIDVEVLKKGLGANVTRRTVERLCAMAASLDAQVMAIRVSEDDTLDLVPDIHQVCFDSD
ncbi:MAG: diguanylate cyclase, partial [Myxococcales bacterium]|nr:diguanylate cyclase [Myxococcales bacterium]